MKKEKRELLETFRISYMNHGKYYYGVAILNDGEFKLEVQTKHLKTADEALEKLKELLVKAYVKILK